MKLPTREQLRDARQLIGCGLYTAKQIALKVGISVSDVERIAAHAPTHRVEIHDKQGNRLTEAEARAMLQAKLGENRVAHDQGPYGSSVGYATANTLTANEAKELIGRQPVNIGMTPMAMDDLESLRKEKRDSAMRSAAEGMGRVAETMKRQADALQHVRLPDVKPNFGKKDVDTPGENE